MSKPIKSNAKNMKGSVEYAKHLRKFGKRQAAQAERRAAKVVIDGDDIIETTTECLCGPLDAPAKAKCPVHGRGTIWFKEKA